MHPVFALWLGLLLLYLIVTGKAEVIIRAWQETLNFKLKGEEEG